MTGKKLTLYAAAMLLGNVLEAASTPRLTIDASPRELQIGDLVEVTLTLDLAAGAAGAGEPSFPNWQRHWGDAEIRSVGKVIRSAGDAPGDAAGDARGDAAGDAEVTATPGAGGGVRYSQTIELASFRPGTLTLPPVTVTLPGGPETATELASAPMTLEITSVLPPGEEQIEPKPPAPPRALPLGQPFWWTSGLLLALAAGLLMFLNRRGPEAVYAGESIDPWKELELALSKLASAADPETVFTGLSLELRRYLGRCLAFPAAESTTTELRRRLIKSGLPSNICGDVVRLLIEADTVKFAKKTPAPGRISECLDQTRVAATGVRDYLQRDETSATNEAAA